MSIDVVIVIRQAGEQAMMVRVRMCVWNVGTLVHVIIETDDAFTLGDENYVRSMATSRRFLFSNAKRVPTAVQMVTQRN